VYPERPGFRQHPGARHVAPDLLVDPGHSRTREHAGTILAQRSESARGEGAQDARRELVGGVERLEGELGERDVHRRSERRLGAQQRQLVAPPAQAQRQGDLRRIRTVAPRRIRAE
jgi:hypothetical protein